MKNLLRANKITRFDIEAFLIGAAFIWVGIYHFLNQGFFEAIVPTWFPYPKLANLTSGVTEIILGAGLMIRKYRRFASWGLLILLALVYPANIDMFINDVDTATNAAGVTERIVDADGVRVRNFIRLPFQLLFAWLVWRHTKVRPPKVE